MMKPEETINTVKHSIFSRDPPLWRWEHIKGFLAENEVEVWYIPRSKGEPTRGDEFVGVVDVFITRSGRLIAKVKRTFTNQEGAAITRWEEYLEWAEAHKREYNEPPLPDAPHVPDVAEAAGHPAEEGRS